MVEMDVIYLFDNNITKYTYYSSLMILKLEGYRKIK